MLRHNRHLRADVSAGLWTRLAVLDRLFAISIVRDRDEHGRRVWHVEIDSGVLASPTTLSSGTSLVKALEEAAYRAEVLGLLRSMTGGRVRSRAQG